MKVLIDTNIILDVLYAREPFVADSSKIFKYCELKQVDGYISALSIPNIIYVMRKELDREKVRQVLSTLSNIFSIIDLRGTDLIKAADTDIIDYEDAIQFVCASRIDADYIVTRNLKDFKDSTIPEISPSSFLAELSNENDTSS